MSKYPVLGTLASIARALGWIAIILGGIVLLVSLSGLSSASSSPSGFMGGILGFVVAIVIAGFGLSLVIVGELIQVFLDIEENTRETVKALSVPGVTVAGKVPEVSLSPRCSKCGAKNEVGSKFCEECGTPL